MPRQLEFSISTLRVASARASLRFYSRMGFKKIFEHGGNNGFPLFVEIRRDAVSFFLSEHNGDGPFGVRVYVRVADAPALAKEFLKLEVPAGKVEWMEWEQYAFDVTDLDGNTLTFASDGEAPQ